MRGSPESVVVKFSAIEIKVQFTILLENFEQDFRLLTNDLSNLLLSNLFKYGLIAAARGAFTSWRSISLN